MKILHTIAFTLLVIGGLNWLLIGLFNYNVVTYLGDMGARIVYILVGVSAVVEIAKHKHNCRQCNPGDMATKPPM